MSLKVFEYNIQCQQYFSTTTSLVLLIEQSLQRGTESHTVQLAPSSHSNSIRPLVVVQSIHTMPHVPHAS